MANFIIPVIDILSMHITLKHNENLRQIELTNKKWIIDIYFFAITPIVQKNNKKRDLCN